MSMLIALALQASAAPQRPWTTFSRSASRARRSERAELFLDGYDRRIGRERHRVRLMRNALDRETEHVLHEVRCPAIAQVAAAVTDVPLPRPQPPGGELLVVGDGVGYTVTLTLSYDHTMGDEITFRSNVGTSLAAWVDAQLARLTSCLPTDP